MELIPILSFIILVATVSTFILAVGAYVLYKIRERKGLKKAAQPAAIPAELVAPTPLPTETGLATQAGMRRTLFEEQPARTTGYEMERRPSFYSTAESKEFGPTYAPTSPPTFAETSRYQKPATGSERLTSTGPKFMRYTNEGYVEPNTEEKKTKKKQETLRWR